MKNNQIEFLEKTNINIGIKKTSNDGLKRKLDIDDKSMHRKLDLKKLSGMHNRQRGKKYERQVKQHGGQGEMSNICLSGILEWKVK